MEVSTSSNWSHSIFSSVVSICCGEMICVINPVSSFWKASFLNPSDTKANWPKFELELVIEASPPLVAWKCLAKPMANTETIWRMALLLILTWVDCQPSL